VSQKLAEISWLLPRCYFVACSDGGKVEIESGQLHELFLLLLFLKTSPWL
jgi:hypothetical protein